MSLVEENKLAMQTTNCGRELIKKNREYLVRVDELNKRTGCEFGPITPHYQHGIRFRDFEQEEEDKKRLLALTNSYLEVNDIDEVLKQNNSLHPKQAEFSKRFRDCIIKTTNKKLNDFLKDYDKLAILTDLGECKDMNDIDTLCMQILFNKKYKLNK